MLLVTLLALGNRLDKGLESALILFEAFGFW